MLNCLHFRGSSAIMKLAEIFRRCENFNAAKDFLRERCILRRDIPRCNVCNRPMTEVKCGRGEELMWRCPSHKTNKLSLRDGSFLNHQGMSLQDFVMVVYVWALQISMTTATEMLGLSPPTMERTEKILRPYSSIQRGQSILCGYIFDKFFQKKNRQFFIWVGYKKQPP
ncbi:unnamed protein product [Acanthosepion pharaonis]|uniref:Uncharacterized protein n=1 Tax=Acanthosepion pharaonis TaxID=158019 RepID=A0A812AP07_ACAPH|nr:unnamed protein product [Sepia pharaonis]